MTERITTQCCIVGGGPAGMMLGFLLARAGVDVVVLEKHGDFLRDFRGDTIHPSTLELMHELGLLSEFLKLPHSEAHTLGGRIGGRLIKVADFRHLPTHCKFIALIPQWDFLNFLAAHGGRYSGFHLRMNAEAMDLIEDGPAVVGVRARTPAGEIDVRAPLVVGCDGRHSLIRAKAGLKVEDIGAPIDVLWFRLSRKPADPTQSLGNFVSGHVFVQIDRGDYWQCAYVIPKGGFDSVKRQGLERFRGEVAQTAPEFADRVAEIGDWDKVKLLTVTVDRLTRWYRPGLLCIGDAAHAMSPIGGVGINLAIADAVAAANILAEPLRSNSLSEDHLKAVQQRREPPTRMMQRLQVFIQDRVITGVLGSTRAIRTPFLVRLFGAFPFLARIPARIVGMGFRPEHIHTPELAHPAPTAKAAE